MNDLILFAKAFNDATRVRIVAALRGGELRGCGSRVGEVCVCELTEALELSQSTLSSHLQVIRQAGLVSTRKRGKWIYYDLEPSQIALIDTLFEAHKAAMKTDKRLQRDAQRLQQRLKMRKNGCCVVGFAPATGESAPEGSAIEEKAKA